ncbi:hypothetical protein EC973_007136 [Apophysomyces ossiformis]|uniref:Alpha/beta hydrolase n=1 Tax=Apophysomyces ossiformis TaxID=679940 RepID=A0A8H7ETH5_9FUNG|nr:hypothetical protein EC973_007136 [Apophysomyces ossiformis]
MANPSSALPAVKKFFTELPRLKVLSRPDDVRSEVTVYVKGSAAYLVGRNIRRLSRLRLPTPASIVGAVAVDVGLHAARLAYQFNTAKYESRERAEMLAWRLLDLRRKHDTLRVVGHSLGCRHITEACGLMRHEERPDSIHLCAPAMVASDILPYVTQGSGGLGRESTAIYYSPKDITLGILLRALLMGEQAVGEIGFSENIILDPSVKMIDASSSLGGYYVGAHTDYADKFHFFAFPSKHRKAAFLMDGTGRTRGKEE